jgi:hypothetical protein
MPGWDDLVTAALLGTDRRPVPDELPPVWAGRGVDPTEDPTGAVLAFAARHRAAVRAGARLPTGPAPDQAPAGGREPAPPEAQQRLADALATGTAGAVNEALSALVVLGALAPEHWTAAATVAAGSPRVDRELLAAALGVRGVWFVGQNPQWSRLAASLQARLAGASS